MASLRSSTGKPDRSPVGLAGRFGCASAMSGLPPDSRHEDERRVRSKRATNGLMHCGKVDLRAAFRVVPKAAMMLDRAASTPGISAASG
jgi:hypothetical protein